MTQKLTISLPPALSKSALGTSVTVPLTVSLHWEALTRAAASNALTSCGAASAGDGDPLKAEVVKLFRRGLSLLRVINSLTATLRRNEWTHALRSNNYANGDKQRGQRRLECTWIRLDSRGKPTALLTLACKSTQLRRNLSHRPTITVDIKLHSHSLFTSRSSTSVQLMQPAKHAANTWDAGNLKVFPSHHSTATTPRKRSTRTCWWQQLEEHISCTFYPGEEGSYLLRLCTFD